jgi:hypothetical protein
MPTETTCCPKCGGTNGHESVLVVAYDINGAWGRPEETTGSERVVHSARVVRCIDCGGRVRREIAEGSSHGG